MMRPSGDPVTDLARQGLAEGQIGAGAAIMVKGDRVWTLLKGEARPGRPVTSTTPFHICSCSKTFTAATFARLVQEGIAEWDMLVRDVVPEFLPPDAPFAALCTFRDLAAMRTGLGRAGVAEWGIRQDIPASERLAFGRHIGLSAPFRDRFSYSNLSYIALALAGERLAGRPYAELVRGLVLDPLGMSQTMSAGQSRTAPADAAEPQMPSRGRMGGVRELTGPNSEGSARIYMPATDAAVWLRSLLSSLRGSDDDPLAGVVQDMARPWAPAPTADRRHAPEGDGRAAYGMGLALSRLRESPLLRHGGGGRGWRHAMALAPDQDAGVMVMAATEAPEIEGLALELLETLAWGDARNWRPVFREAAERAAQAERTLIETGFPVGPDVTSSLRPGRYANPASGLVRIEPAASGLRMVPEEAPDLAASLKPVGPDILELAFEEPALSPQPLDPPFRLRATTEEGRPVLRSTYFGVLGPTA
jgi:CubicO group peptidase (beta-lactamase class C family)